MSCREPGFGFVEVALGCCNGGFGPALRLTIGFARPRGRMGRRGLALLVGGALGRAPFVTGGEALFSAMAKAPAFGSAA